MEICRNGATAHFLTFLVSLGAVMVPVGVSFSLLCVTMRTSQVVQWQRTRLPMQEMQFQSLSWEDTLEEEMATDSSIVAWREEPGGLQSMGLQRVEYDLATKHASLEV